MIGCNYLKIELVEDCGVKLTHLVFSRLFGITPGLTTHVLLLRLLLAVFFRTEGNARQFRAQYMRFNCKKLQGSTMVPLSIFNYYSTVRYNPVSGITNSLRPSVILYVSSQLQNNETYFTIIVYEILHQACLRAGSTSLSPILCCTMCIHHTRIMLMMRRGHRQWLGEFVV